MAVVVFIGLLLLAYGVLLFQFWISLKKIKSEARYLRDYGTEEQLGQRCSTSPVHDHHLLGLALEATDYRTQEEAATDDAEKARYHASYVSVSTEVVDTVLAFNGIDPHPGFILGGQEEDTKEVDDGTKKENIIVQFCDFTKPKGKGY
jgi:hypothetical protein